MKTNEELLREWAEANGTSIHLAKLMHEYASTNEQAQAVGSILEKAEVSLMTDPILQGKWGYDDLLRVANQMGLQKV